MNRFSVLCLVLLLSLCGCRQDPLQETGFCICLADSGTRILTDEHIAAYEWAKHRIVLSPSGIERWHSFIPYDESWDPPVPKLGELNGKEFVVILNGVEKYRGHFTSMVSSLMPQGVLIYDLLDPTSKQVSIVFAPVEGQPQDDPRADPAIKAYFRKQGKLEQESS